MSSANASTEIIKLVSIPTPIPQEFNSFSKSLIIIEKAVGEELQA